MRHIQVLWTWYLATPSIGGIQFSGNWVNAIGGWTNPCLDPLLHVVYDLSYGIEISGHSILVPGDSTDDYWFGNPIVTLHAQPPSTPGDVPALCRLTTASGPLTTYLEPEHTVDLGETFQYSWSVTYTDCTGTPISFYLSCTGGFSTSFTVDFTGDAYADGQYEFAFSFSYSSGLDYTGLISQIVSFPW